jgi:hypothetical protein
MRSRRVSQVARWMFGAAALAVSTSGLAVVDQQNLTFSAGFNVNDPTFMWQQEVRTGIAGQLRSIDLFYDAITPIQPFVFFINAGSGWQTDANDFTTVVTPVDGTFAVDVSSANLSFDVGAVFVFGIVGLGPDVECCNLLGSGLAPGYAQGRLYVNGSPNIGFEPADFLFRTNVAAVPEPETYALMLLGLAAAGVLRGRSRAHRAPARVGRADGAVEPARS